VKGAVDFNRFPAAPRPGSPGNPAYRVSTATSATAPSLTTSLYLDNIGVAALGRMVPALSIVPTAGSVSGKIEMALRERDLDCKTDLVLTNVAYAPDPDSPAVRGRTQVIQQSLKDFRANGRIASGCSGNLDNADYRPINVIHVGTTRQAVRTAPPVVQQAAAFDYTRLSGQVADGAKKDMADMLNQKVAAAAVGALGNEMGGAVAQSLGSSATASGRAARPSSKGNPVTGGVKKLGSGIKGLFAGNKDKKGK
jgi:hypothetical protein